tara:strand:- start:633 stop:1127 length:495 start_codon:yes stop_codon:yes gene_type:complete
MAVSPQMQTKLDKIDALVKDGYTLSKSRGFISLKNSHGKDVNIFGGFLSFSGPAGFSWIAFFFAPIVCAQIKEKSFFNLLCVLTLIETIASILFNIEISVGGLLLSFLYANMFPYYRYMAVKDGVEELPKVTSIVLSIIYSIAALIPSFALAFIYALIRASLSQ